jgi:hypothetical protein
MTATDIEIPDYITRAKSLADMMQAVADLLEQATGNNLPTPSHATLYQAAKKSGSASPASGTATTPSPTGLPGSAAR